MTIQTGRLSDPAVRAFVGAVTPTTATRSWRCSPRTRPWRTTGLSQQALAEWVDREIFTTHGHLEVDSESDGGRALLARYSSDTWGEMRTRWRFTVEDDGRVSRFETGQA